MEALEEKIKILITDFVDIYDIKILVNRGNNPIVDNLIERITALFEEQRREELIKFKKWIDSFPICLNVFPDKEHLLTTEQLINEYLKSLKP